MNLPISLDDCVGCEYIAQRLIKDCWLAHGYLSHSLNKLFEVEFESGKWNVTDHIQVHSRYCVCKNKKVGISEVFQFSNGTLPWAYAVTIYVGDYGE